MKLSLILPAIRTHLWERFYDSAVKACLLNEWELVIVGPFDLPYSLRTAPNITIVKDYGNPSRATQIAVDHAKGDLILNCVDDGVFFKGCLDSAIDQYNKECTRKDVLNLRYRELVGSTGAQLHSGFWNAHAHEELRLPGISSQYGIALHFMMSRKYYRELGGIDCQFEYSNHGIHDLMFRIQADGGILFNSNVEGLNCDHMPGISGDHKAVHDAQTYHDKPIFDAIYSDVNAAVKRRNIEFDNWKNVDVVWERRFDPDNLPMKYEDLV